MQSMIPFRRADSEEEEARHVEEAMRRYYAIQYDRDRKERRLRGLVVAITIIGVCALAIWDILNRLKARLVWNVKLPSAK